MWNGLGITIPHSGPPMKRGKNEPDPMDEITDILIAAAENSNIGARVEADNSRNHDLSVLKVSTFVPTLVDVDEHGNAMSCMKWMVRYIEDNHPVYLEAIMNASDTRKSTLAYRVMGQYHLDLYEDHSLIQFQDGVFDVASQLFTAGEPATGTRWGRLKFDCPFPQDLDTPLWDSIKERQGYNEYSSEVFDAMAGRSLVFPTATREIIPVFHGVPCTGKSRVQEILHALANPACTTVIDLGGGPFSLSGLESSKSCFAQELQWGDDTKIGLVLSLANPGEVKRVSRKYMNDLVRRIPIPLTVIGNRPLYDARHKALKRRAINLPFLCKLEGGTEDNFHERVLKEEGAKLIVKLTRAWMSFLERHKSESDWSAPSVLGPQLYSYNQAIHHMSREEVLQMFVKSCFTLMSRTMRQLNTESLKKKVFNTRVQAKQQSSEYFSVTTVDLRKAWAMWTERTGMDPGYLDANGGFAKWIKEQYRIETVPGYDEYGPVVFGGLSLKPESEWTYGEGNETPASCFLRFSPNKQTPGIPFPVPPEDEEEDFFHGTAESEEDEEVERYPRMGDIRSYFIQPT